MCVASSKWLDTPQWAVGWGWVRVTCSQQQVTWGGCQKIYCPYVWQSFDTAIERLCCVVLFGLTVCFGFSTGIISVNLFIHFHKSVGFWTVRTSWWRRQQRQWWRCGPSSFGASEPGWLHHWQVRFQDQRAPWGEHHLLLNFEVSWLWTLFKQHSNSEGEDSWQDM